MTPGDVDKLIGTLRAKTQAQIDSQEKSKSMLGALFGSNSDIQAAQDSLQQLVAMPGDDNYQSGLASNLYNLQVYGEAGAGDADSEAKFQSVCQLVSDQVGYGSVAIQFSTATSILSSTAAATAEQIKADVPSVPEALFGLGTIGVIALCVVGFIAYVEFSAVSK